MKNLLLIIGLAFVCHLGAEEQLVNIFNKSNKYFEVKGNFFPREKNKQFPIEEKELYLITDEEIEKREEGSFFIKMTLLSINEGSSQEFKSILINNDKTSTITHVKELKRYIRENTYTETFPDSFDSHYHVDYPCWDVWIEQDVQLKDGSSYLVKTNKREYYSNNAQNTLHHLPPLKVGDVIHWDRQDYRKIIRTPENETLSVDGITRNGKKHGFEEVVVKGLVRKTQFKTLDYVHDGQGIFALNGYYFRYDPHGPFPINRNQSYVLMSEEQVSQPYGGYSAKIGLALQGSTETSYFVSLIMNDTPTSSITDIASVIEHFYHGDEESGLMVGTYKVVLDEGSTYVVSTMLSVTAEMAEQMSDTLSILPGDEIVWGDENNPYDPQPAYFFNAQILRNGEKVPFFFLKIHGDTRKKNPKM